MRALDVALASFNVQRQAYFSGSFVGNHIHRALKVWLIMFLFINVDLILQEINLNTLCEAIPKLANSRCPSLATKATFTATLFKKAFSLFRECHAVYDCAQPLSFSEIATLG